MRKFLYCLALTALLLPAAGKKSKSDKPPEVTLSDFLVQRENRRLLLDGVVEVNDVQKPLRGLRIKFKLLDADNRMISQKEATISEERLEPGDEVSFALQCADHVRAVGVLVELRGKKRMFLRLDNPGPYEIH